MGSSAPGSHAQNCSATKVPVAGLSPLADNQRVGLATARSPDGPWSRPNVPILEPSSPGHWDDLFTTNPLVHVFNNGSVLLVYKGRSKEYQNAMMTGTAFAQHWSGPYNWRSGPMDIPTDCEDAGVYLSRSGVLRELFHCGCDYRVVWSLDGINWNATAPAQHVTYQDGSQETLSRRERPQWIVDEKTGEPMFCHQRRVTHRLTREEGVYHDHAAQMKLIPVSQQANILCVQMSNQYLNINIKSRNFITLLVLVVLIIIKRFEALCCSLF